MNNDIDTRLAEDAERTRAAALTEAETLAMRAVAAGIDGNTVLKSAFFRQAAPLYRRAGYDAIARMCVKWADRAMAEPIGKNSHSGP